MPKIVPAVCSILLLIAVIVAIIYIIKYQKEASKTLPLCPSCETCPVCPKAEACPTCPKCETCPTCPVISPLQLAVSTNLGTFTTQKGMDYPGNDMLSTPNVANADQCTSMCGFAPSCKMAMYQPSTKNCWLKSAKGSPVANATLDAYIKN